MDELPLSLQEVVRAVERDRELVQAPVVILNRRDAERAIALGWVDPELVVISERLPRA